MNAWRAPARVVAAHHPNQIPDLLRHSGPTGLAAPDLPRPEQAEALAVPSDDGLRLDDHQHGFPLAHTRRSQTQKIRSAGVSRSRFGADRRNNSSCCRKAKFSSRNWAELLNSEATAPHTANKLCRADQRNSKSRSTSMIADPSEYFGGTVVCASEKPGVFTKQTNKTKKLGELVVLFPFLSFLS